MKKNLILIILIIIGIVTSLILFTDSLATPNSYLVQLVPIATIMIILIFLIMFIYKRKSRN